MEAEEQAIHVWKHLLNPDERWEDLVAFDLSRETQSAAELGCPSFQRNYDPRPFSSGVDRRLVGLHDRYYLPGYQAQLSADGGVWAPHALNHRRLVLQTPGGLIVVLSKPDRLVRTVITAMRPTHRDRPTLASELGELADAYFAKHSRDEDPRRWAVHVESELIRALKTVGADEEGAIALGIAIGHTRALGAHFARGLQATASARWAAVRPRLDADRAAVAMLDAVATHLPQVLLPSLDLDGLFERLGAAEDAVALADALDAGPAFDEACRRFVDTLASGPTELLNILPSLASWSRSIIAGQSARLSRFWLTIADAARRAGPSHWLPLITRDGIVPPGVEEWLASVEPVRRPILTGEPIPVPALTAPPVPTDCAVRVFVLDEEHPAGRVAARERAFGRLWLLDAPSALVVVVTHPRQVPALALDDLIHLADRDPELAIAARAFSRPS